MNMTAYKRLLFNIFPALLLFILVGLQLSDAARGGSRGGSRIGSRGGSRSIRRSSSGSRVSSIAWKAALVTGIYYGSQRYMTRRRYYSGSQPEICENYEQTDVNGTRLGKFVCPLGEQPDDFAHCCGSDGRERCCKFFDSPGRTAGVVIGILIVFGIIGIVLFCCFKRYKKSHKAFNKKHKPCHNDHATNKTQHIPMTTNAGNNYPMASDPNIPPPGTQYYPPMQTDYGVGYPPAGALMDPPGYPPAGAPMNMPGYPPAGAPMDPPGYPPAGAPMDMSGYPPAGAPPPAYEKSGNLPYSPDPTNIPGSGAPPPMPSGDAGLPYAMNPGMPPPGFSYNQPGMPGQGYAGQPAPPYPGNQSKA